ncbi:MAG: M23 family metallopeptidase [Spirochaetales bacterium]
MQLKEKYLHVGYAVLTVPVLALLIWMGPWRLTSVGSMETGNPEDALQSGQGQPDLFPLELEVNEPPPPSLEFTTHKVAPGETISGIANQYGITQDTLISWNRIEKARTLQIGRLLLVPSMSGLMHEVREGDTLEAIVRKYDVDLDSIREVNRLEEDVIFPGMRLFIPDARLPSVELRKVWGELFRYPIRGWVSSRYGWRKDPITGARRFHNGIDIGGYMGEPVRAALDGRVIETGYNRTAGNYVILSHVGGYRTFYAHLSAVSVGRGTYVRQGQKIGEVGSTGYSTGPHLHFSVFRWGRSVNPMLLLY